MWDETCRWARPRLALLAGGELTGSDRRKVERHLIGCGDCRDRMNSLNASLGALRMLGAEPLFSVDSPSLWPALARQIREERRPEPAFWSRPQSWIGAAVAASLLLTAGAVGSWSLAQAQRGKTLRTAAISSPRRVEPVASTSAAVSEVNGSPTVADNSGRRPEGENPVNPATSGTNSPRGGGSPGAGVRMPEPTH